MRPSDAVRVLSGTGPPMLMEGKSLSKVTGGLMVAGMGLIGVLTGHQLVFQDPLLVLMIVCFLVVAMRLARNADFWLTIAFLVLMANQTHLPAFTGMLDRLRWVPLFALAFFAIAKLAETRGALRRYGTHDFVILSWVGLAFASSVYSISPGLTIQRAFTLGLVYVAIFAAFWRYVDGSGEDRALFLLLAAAAVMYGVSWFLYFTDPSAVLAGRFRGFLANPNTMGLLTALLFPIVLYYALKTPDWRFLLLLVVMGTSAILSGNRGSLFTILVSSSYVLWVARHALRWVPLGGAVLLGLAFAGAIPIPVELQPYFRANLLATGSGRLEVWPILVDYVRAKPWFGYGFGTEDLLLQELNEQVRFAEFRGGYAHNSYLGLAMQVGIVGALGFFLPLLAILVKGLLRVRKAGELQPEHCYLAVLVTGLIVSFFESWIYSMGNAMAFPFWMVIMLLIRRQYSHRPVVEGAPALQPMAVA